MGIPVVVVSSGGLGVTVAPGGVPMEIASNGYGIAVRSVTNGLPVSGITFGPDVTAPIITSSNTISQPENTALVHFLSANETVTWAKVGGADSAKFTLGAGATAGQLSLPAKDFENPDDAGLNNTYIVQVQATDTASNASLVQTITVTITDVFEVGPTAPVLAMDAAWVTTDSTPDFTIDVDDTIGAGNSVRLQIQAAGGDWSSPVDDVTHVITAPEDAANEINVASGSVSNGNYQARARVDNGTPSAWSNVVSFTVAVPVTYAGPGDIVSGALGWFSPARAYTAAFAALGGPIMDITDSANLNPATINILSTGFVDLTTLNAWITAHGTAYVKQLYDQTGNSRHVLNATTSQRPTITQSALNGLPALTGVAASTTFLASSATLSQAMPYSFAAVGKRTASFTTVGAMIGSGGSLNAALSFTTAANTVGVTGANLAYATLGSVADSSFHAVLGIVTSLTSGFVSADGVDGSTADVGGTVFSSNPIRVMRMAPGNSLTGQVMECGLWGIGLSGAQRTALNSNMHGTSGYNF